VRVFAPQVVAVAKKEGKYDATGIIKPGCESIEFRWVVNSCTEVWTSGVCATSTVTQGCTPARCPEFTSLQCC